MRHQQIKIELRWVKVVPFEGLHRKELAYEVKVDDPNPVFARMLQQAIGGVEGEMRVMNQYLFQAWSSRGPERYRDMLLHTGTEEIGHIEMLATAVAMNLDGAPTSVEERLRSIRWSRRRWAPASDMFAPGLRLHVPSSFRGGRSLGRPMDERKVGRWERRVLRGGGPLGSVPNLAPAPPEVHDGLEATSNGGGVIRKVKDAVKN